MTKRAAAAKRAVRLELREAHGFIRRGNYGWASLCLREATRAALDVAAELRQRPARVVGRSLLVWLVFGALTWLDARGPHFGGQHAAIFGFIITALIWIGNAIEVAGTYIAVSLETFVQYIWTSLGWLTRRVADILSNTGAMFARVWQSAKLFYTDVLRPALIWLHDFYERLRSWLTKVLAPVLRWAKRVRDELLSLYKRFVRPILDILDTTRRVLDILVKLHVPFARQLDAWVTQAEQTITANYLKLLGIINKTIDTINGILTLDGYLQRFLFLRTIERDVFYVWRALVNVGTRPLTDAEAKKLRKFGAHLSASETADQLAAFWKGEHNDVGNRVDQLGTVFASYLKSDRSA